MSGFVLAPLTLIAPTVISTVVNSAGSAVWYTASGLWWLGKRAIYGYQPTAEEILQKRLDEQQALLEKQSAMLEQLLKTEKGEKGD